MRRRNPRSGFTLIECVISLLVLAVAAYLVVAWLGRASAFSREAALAALPAAIQALRVDLESGALEASPSVEGSQLALVWREAVADGFQHWQSRMLPELLDLPETIGVVYLVELEQMESNETDLGRPFLVSFHLTAPPTEGETLSDYLQRATPGENPLCQYPMLLRGVR